ncbi:hypothetical protein BJ508DRAFT_410516 [Ascobolus immersus RN42]|uniref:Uncharacterized protein n=1 Tax=Ascobolus immersus RN42 TaxID=1160509 RepID=A0A3N4ISX0_ASCIM|nr:hypothetical protein BJ508DRAFT_410516 [Ascobolus immersus RN42]
MYCDCPPLYIPPPTYPLGPPGPPTHPTSTILSKDGTPHFIWEYLSGGTLATSFLPLKETSLVRANATRIFQRQYCLYRAGEGNWWRMTCGEGLYVPYRDPAGMKELDAMVRKEERAEREDWRLAVPWESECVQVAVGKRPKMMLWKLGVLDKEGRVRRSFARACAEAQAEGEVEMG